MSPLALIPMPYRLLALALLAAALVGYGWVKGAQHGEGRLAKYVSQQDKAHIEALNRAAAKTKAWQQKKDEALHAANTRAKNNAKAAAAARRTAASLRDDLAAARARVPDASIASLRAHTATLNAVFGECTQEVERLAGEAAGHASDSLTLQQSWPQP